MQVHDFNARIAPSGLFWIVRLPDSALTTRGRSVRIAAENIAVVDSFTLFGPIEIPATVSFDVRFTSFGDVRNLRPGANTRPTDPTSFAGEFFNATATGSFSGTNRDGFSFQAPLATNDDLWGEMGTERNGSFLP